MKTAIFSIGVFLISLFLGSCQPSETSCSVVDTGKALDYKIGNKLLFSYNYTTVYPAPGVDSVYKRSGFIFIRYHKRIVRNEKISFFCSRYRQGLAG